MSRICVKNLPTHATENRIRDFFSQKGEITDTKLMRTKDGKSRQFAFVGFRTEQEAEEAMKFFNNSYMDTSKITCEVARKVGDPNIPRPWSRYSAKGDESTKEKKKNPVGKDIETTLNESKKFQNNEYNNDPKLQEFLKVMQPRAKSKIWEDDILSAALVDQDDKKANKEEANISKSKKKKNTKENEIVRQSDEVTRNDDISDMDYFKSKVKKDWSDSESDHEDSHDEAELKSNVQNVEMEEASSVSSDIEQNESDTTTVITSESKNGFETNRLFIRNLPYTANEDDLLELFSQFGEVSQVHVVVDKDTKRSKGIAYVLFKLSECAIRALGELDSSIFQGRLLHIMPAQPPQINAEKPESDLGQGKKNFKQNREEQRKASEASGNTRAWNSFYLHPDTVVEYIARKHGISKGDLLDGEADDLPVRATHTEAQVIRETKKYLSSAGVNITALEEFASKKSDNSKRSNHIILVKHLPYGSSEGELANMFKKFGSLEKIILPSTKGLALVIFLEAAEARVAFKKLAYKRYKDSPLYLEWAPADVLCPQKLEKDESDNTVSEINKSVLLEQTLGGKLEDEIDSDRVESRTLCVKNLNFKTSNECLEKYFIDHMKSGSIKSVKVQKHVKNGKYLSAGYGFIEFDSIETASNVRRELQGTVLDGHALKLEFSHTKNVGQILKRKDKDFSSTKIIWKNVAFEATKKELRQLFSPFGQIKSVRLPRKLDGHRGFAFIDFVTKQEAQNALQALANTHFYGRSMVLERAKEGETLEELRERTAAQIVDEQNGFQKLSSKRKGKPILDEGKTKSARI